jgi:hypothetical protein
MFVAIWQRGTLVMQPAERSLQPKEVPLETFFHKNILFKDKDDQFRTGAQGTTVGRPNA